MQQGGFQGGSDQGFKVAAADFGIGVLRAYDLALLGQADLSAHRARWLRQDRLVTRAAAASHRAAPAMEHAQLDVVRFMGPHACHCVCCAAPRGDCPTLGRPGGSAGEFVKKLNQRNLGAVELPVAGEDAAILVAV